MSLITLASIFLHRTRVQRLETGDAAMRANQLDDILKAYHKVKWWNRMTASVPWIPQWLKDFLANGLKIATVVSVAYLVRHAFYWYCSPERHWLRFALSEVLWRTKRDCRVAHSVMRAELADTVMPKVNVVANHTHGEAAALRTTAIQFARLYAAKLGLKPYSVQRSAADERAAVDGDRVYYWGKDFIVRPKLWHMDPGDLAMLIDVDYYIDMPFYLASTITPVLLYTFIPDAVAGGDKGYVYTFDGNNNLHLQVCGGAEYKHQLWNYGVDNLIARHRPWWSPIPLQAQTFLVDKRMVGPNRYVVVLTPTAHWGLLTAWLTWFIDGPLLERLHPVVHPEWLQLRVLAMNGMMVSTARVSTHTAVNLTSEQYDAVIAINNISKVALPVQAIVQVLPNRDKAAILCDFFRSTTRRKCPTVYPVAEGLRRYQVMNRPYDDTAKPNLVPFMSPLYHGAFSPDNCTGTDRAAVQLRMKDVQNSVVVTPYLLTHMHAFVEQLVPVPYVLAPTDTNEVFDRLERPIQKDGFFRAAGAMLMKAVMRMFVKKEAYGDCKAPRPICTINDVDKVEYAMYIYAYLSYLKTIRWYVFGKKPCEIADCVTAICTSAKYIVKDDCDKMDGRINNLCRDLDRMIFMRLFHPRYHKALSEIMRRQHNLPAVTRNGVVFKTDNNRLSGSFETSPFNTHIAAFIHFSAFMSLGFTKHEAWAKLGLYGGDDGITADLPVEYLEQSAERVGQSIKAVKVERGQLGVEFLARMYSPAVWEGQNDSCSDIRRQISKLHVTVNLPPYVTPKMRLIEKARAYMYMDANTPILGEFCARVMQLATQEELALLTQFAQELQVVIPWSAKTDPQSHYPNENYLNWMHAIVLRDLPGWDNEMFQAHLKCDNLDDLMKPPLCHEIVEPTPKIPVFVDGTQVPLDARVEYVFDPDVKDPGVPMPRHEMKEHDKSWRVDNGRLRNQPSGVGLRPSDVSAFGAGEPRVVAGRLASVDKVVEVKGPEGREQKHAPSIQCGVPEKDGAIGPSRKQYKFGYFGMKPTEMTAVQRLQSQGFPISDRNSVKPRDAVVRPRLPACKWGVRCRVKTCKFGHPTQWRPK